MGCDTVQRHLQAIIAQDQHFLWVFVAQIDAHDLAIFAGSQHLIQTQIGHNDFVYGPNMAGETTRFHIAARGNRYLAHLTITSTRDQTETALIIVSTVVDEFRLKNIRCVAAEQCPYRCLLGPIPDDDTQIVRSTHQQITRSIEIQAIDAAVVFLQFV